MSTAKLTPQQFAIRFGAFARETEEKTGISALAILAQAALESGWGQFAPGNMFFGVKDSDGVNGNEQLLTTTEYSKRYDLKFPVIISIEPVIRNGEKYFQYRVKDYFRRYNTPEESFTDHANLFVRVKRYSKAMKVKNDAFMFIEEIAAAGYATDPNYAAKLKQIAKLIQKYL
jgi:flagellar protein FlgJ